MKKMKRTTKEKKVFDIFLGYYSILLKIKINLMCFFLQSIQYDLTM